MPSHIRTRDRRHEWTRAQILTAAWELARRDGLAGMSLRELADQVGMRAPSLYTYFPSKNDLYDAMYAEGMRAFETQLQRAPTGRNAQEALRRRIKAWVAAAVEDPVRYELLFERSIPDFAPSAESLAIGLTNFAETRGLAAAAGLRSQKAFDLLIATTRGLVGMQIANEPGGRRWVGLVDQALDILIDHYDRTD
jgi:AcrR family transcriptional regulator